jgi:HEAT repeat protein
MYAATALVGTTDKVAIGALVGALRDGDERVRQQVALALGSTGDPAAAEGLAAVLVDRSADEGARVNAARALGSFSDVRSRAVLADATTDVSARIRTSAIYALGRSATAAEADGLGAPAAEAQGDGRDAPRLTDEELAAMVASLRDPLTSIKYAALVSLGRARETHAAGAILELLGDNSPEVREAAAKALGHIGDPTAAESLVRLMDCDTDEWVRNIAAKALAEMSHPCARAVPLEPIDEGAPILENEPIQWNSEVTSNILDLTRGTEIGQRVQESGPAAADAGTPVGEAAARQLLRRMKTLVKVTYLPPSVGSHFVRRSGVTVRPILLEGWSGQVHQGQTPVVSKAIVVRYMVRGHIIQIVDTEYDTVIYVAREGGHGKQRKDGLKFMIETAVDVLKNHAARRAQTPEDFDLEAGAEGGVPQRDVQWPRISVVGYDKSDYRELYRLVDKSGLSPGWFYSSTDGYWVEFRVMKEDELGNTKLMAELVRRSERMTAK